MSAREALAGGLVHEVLAPEALMPCAQELAEVISGQSPTALTESLQILRRYARSLIADELDEAWSIAHRHFSHTNGTEGPLAFMEGSSSLGATGGTRMTAPRNGIPRATVPPFRQLGSRQ
jgi:enoyl-CoA hydratase/carnithine racemase